MKNILILTFHLTLFSKLASRMKTSHNDMETRKSLLIPQLRSQTRSFRLPAFCARFLFLYQKSATHSPGQKRTISMLLCWKPRTYAQNTLFSLMICFGTFPGSHLYVVFLFMCPRKRRHRQIFETWKWHLKRVPCNLIIFSFIRLFAF